MGNPHYNLKIIDTSLNARTILRCHQSMTKTTYNMFGCPFSAAMENIGASKRERIIPYYAIQFLIIQRFRSKCYEPRMITQGLYYATDSVIFRRGRMGDLTQRHSKKTTKKSDFSIWQRMELFHTFVPTSSVQYSLAETQYPQHGFRVVVDT